MAGAPGNLSGGIGQDAGWFRHTKFVPATSPFALLLQQAGEDAAGSPEQAEEEAAAAAPAARKRRAGGEEEQAADEAAMKDIMMTRKTKKLYQGLQKTRAAKKARVTALEQKAAAIKGR